MSPICLLLLPALVSSKLIIDIDITDFDHPLLDVRGERTATITDTEREFFKIRDEQLKIAIAKTTNDIQPSDVSVKSTGKSLDLHKKYKWDDVKRTVKPILRIKDKVCDGATIIEKSNAFVNSSYDWKLHENISIEAEYDIYIHDEAAPTFNITSFGRNFSNSSEYHFGKKVQAQSCLVSVLVSYHTTLTGRVAAYYPAKRQNHYYWSYDVNYILIGADLPTRVINEHTLFIKYDKEVV